MSKHTPTIFVVDDDIDVRTSLSRALKLRGFTVETYSSAPAFLDEFDPDRPGCLVLDQGMPHMTGLELQEVLLERGHSIPIIFMTGHGGVNQSVQAMKQGAVDFLEKPFRQDFLVERIEVALEMDSNTRSQNLN